MNLPFRLNPEGKNVPETFNVTLKRGIELMHESDKAIMDLMFESNGVGAMSNDLMAAIIGVAKTEEEVLYMAYSAGIKIHILHEKQQSIGSSLDILSKMFSGF